MGEASSHMTYWPSSPLTCNPPRAIAFVRSLSRHLFLLCISDNRIFKGRGCQPHAQPPTWRAWPLYLWPPETGWPSYTPRHWVPILRHAWAKLGLFLTSGHHTQNWLYWCVVLKPTIALSVQHAIRLVWVLFFPENRVGITQAWMPTYVSILRIPQMIWVCRATVERYWQEKPKNSEKNLSQCHFVHQKFHMDWPGCEPGPPRWEADD
jgi:hypothetical protein